jgi:hypothetical protein
MIGPPLVGARSIVMPSDYYGLPVARLSNGLVALEVLAGAGPRVVRLMAPGGENLLAELPGVGWDTPQGRYTLHGGHRLWHGPEGFPRSYQPDDAGVLEELPGGLRVSQPAEPATGIAKRVTLTLAAGAARVTVRHELRNEGLWPVELAPWAITQLRPGGTAIVPLGATAPQGGPLPDRSLVLWPYTRWGDRRITLGDDLALAQARVGEPPAKLGTFCRLGWCAYLLRDTLLVKRFTPRPGLPHADRGCNVEVYFDQYGLELETLGPLARLAPGEAAEHTEEWELLVGVAAAPGLEGARRLAAAIAAGR